MLSIAVTIGILPVAVLAADSEPPPPPVTTFREAPWIRRHRPARGVFELGLASGVLLVSPLHDLFDPEIVFWSPRKRAAANFVGRFGYYPVAPLGLEIEGAAAASSCDTCGRAPIFGFRGHVVGQLPLARIAPFVVAGGGFLATRGVFGKDLQPTFHFGGGFKWFFTRWVGLRIDARAHLARAYPAARAASYDPTILVQDEGGRNPTPPARPPRTFYPEILASVIVTLGRPYTDTDGDGLPDPGQRARVSDQCPLQPGLRRHHGCPDRDGDDLRDRDDACPDQAGSVARNGCPGLVDRDGDGFYDPDQYAIPEGQLDACPDDPGVREYDGCPAPDSDGDGLNDLVDRCPDEPEVVNGYADDDGCPDQLPLDVVRILGTVRGIHFGFLSDRLTANSLPVLTDIAAVLNEYAELRLEIQGHTDSDGDAAANKELSLRRAESIRQVLIDAGVAADRLRAVGYGDEFPVVSNDTDLGRATNRRIEFRLVDGTGNILEHQPETP